MWEVSAKGHESRAVPYNAGMQIVAPQIRNVLIHTGTKIKEHKLRKLRVQSLHHKLGVRIRSFPEMTKTDKALGLSLSLV